jgi:hypothetical protein
MEGISELAAIYQIRLMSINKIKKETLVVLYFIISGNLMACECSGTSSVQKLDSISYKWADVVLLGKIVQINYTNYQIEIIEIFKGKTSSNRIIGIYSDDINYELSSCAFNPGMKNEYLLYLKETKKGNITYYFADQCLANRTLDLKDCPVDLMRFDKNELIIATNDWITKIRKR